MSIYLLFLCVGHFAGKAMVWGQGDYVYQITTQVRVYEDELRLVS